jgi:hypothetical protein
MSTASCLLVNVPYLRDASVTLSGSTVSRRLNTGVPCFNTEGTCIFFVSVIWGRGRYSETKEYRRPVWIEFTQYPRLETTKSRPGLSQGEFAIGYSGTTSTSLPCFIMMFRILKVAILVYFKTGSLPRVIRVIKFRRIRRVVHVTFMAEMHTPF